MFADKQDPKKFQLYKDIIKAIGELSGLYSDSDCPFISYRFQENSFCIIFDMVNNSRADDSIDAFGLDKSSMETVGIGLKTWVGSDNQKIAEFGKLRTEYTDLSGIELVKKISGYRNDRIKTSINLHKIKINNLFYHILKRVPNSVLIYESTFDYINLDKIVLLPDKSNANNIYFKDDKHTYHFSLAKNTLYMIFDNLELLDKVDVDIIKNPFDVILNFSKQNIKFDKKDKKEELHLKLYSETKSKGFFVPEKSGLNQWNGSRKKYKYINNEKVLIGETKRDINELYIPFPAEERNKNKDFFPPRDTPFTLILPDRQKIKAKVCQDGGKAIMSCPNSVLGKWLLRDVLEIPESNTKPITYEFLQIHGIDSVVFTKLNDKEYSIDFCNNME